MQGDRTYFIGPVKITRHHFEWGDADPTFVETAWITQSRVLSELLTNGHYYFNPIFTVTASKEVDEELFLVQARRACALWNKQIGKVIGSAARKRAAKGLAKSIAKEIEEALWETLTAEEITKKAKDEANRYRMLAFSGVLIINGRHVHSKRLGQRQEKYSQSVTVHTVV